MKILISTMMFAAAGLFSGIVMANSPSVRVSGFVEITNDTAQRLSFFAGSNSASTEVLTINTINNPIAVLLNSGGVISFDGWHSTDPRSYAELIVRTPPPMEGVACLFDFVRTGDTYSIRPDNPRNSVPGKKTVCSCQTESGGSCSGLQPAGTKEITGIPLVPI